MSKDNRKLPLWKAAGWKKKIKRIDCVFIESYMIDAPDGRKLQVDVESYSKDMPKELKGLAFDIYEACEESGAPEINIRLINAPIDGEISPRLHVNWSKRAGELLAYRNLFYCLPRYIVKRIKPYLVHPEKLEFREEMRDDALGEIGEERRKMRRE